MNRWSHLPLFVALFVALAARAAEKPNIVFILADDLGYGDVRAFNPESKIPTPHLDRLAAAGMRFTDAHTSSSVCTPTRYGLLTGRYNWRSRLPRGVLGAMSDGPPMPSKTLPPFGTRNAICPVIRLYRVGVQTVAGLCASVKRIPSRASRSMCGVATIDWSL